MTMRDIKVQVLREVLKMRKKEGKRRKLDFWIQRFKNV